MHFSFLKQLDSVDCGPTCLAMICRWYGKSIPTQVLRDKTQIDKQGVSLLAISEAAESIGFKVHSVKISFTELINETPLPTILHWDQNHFIVLYKISGKKISIADPGKGLITLQHKEFKDHWLNNLNDNCEEGIALLLEPTESFFSYKSDNSQYSNNSNSQIKSIFSYLSPYKKLIIQLFIGLGISTFFQFIIPFLSRSIIDVGINTANLHFVYVVLLAQLALVSGKLMVDFVRSWILLHISTRINFSILNDFILKLTKLPMNFFDSKRTGDLMQRMTDHQRIESFLTGSSLNILFSFINLIIFSVVLSIFNFRIFLVFIIASIFYSIWVLAFLKKRKQLDYNRFDISSKEQNIKIQLIQGMQEIKLYGCENSMSRNWSRIQGTLFNLSIKNLSLNQWQQSGAFLINEGKNILITFLSAKAVIDGQMTLGSMLAIQNIIGQLNSPIEQMINFIQSWQNAKISIDRLNEIHKIEDEEPVYKKFIHELPEAFTKKLVGGKVSSDEIYSSTNEIFPVETVNHCVEFKNVSFTYPGAGNEPVLKNISLKIPKGKITAIVGASGSGKTTLLKLLLKFYEPQKGEIKLDKILFKEISHSTWRKHCGIVMQESFIFSDSIAKNIAIGEEEFDTYRLNQAIEIANLKEFIDSLPLGFDTKIGAEGNGLSMGQKQRILIARSVYRNPDFIFFDEATNSLDANNESIIIQNLKAFFEGKTVIVVAHRLSTVKHASQIVVLNRGYIKEIGTHRDLINLKGEYFTLIKNQLELGE